MPKGPEAAPQRETALQAINQLDLFTALSGGLTDARSAGNDGTAVFQPFQG